MSTARLLSNNGINSVDSLLNTTIEQLTSIKGIGNKKAKAIYNSVQQKRSTILDVAQFITIEEKTGALIGKSFVFTGVMETARDVLMQMAIDNGGEAKKSVSKTTTYLVLADPNSNTVKAKKARANGTECISEKEFLNLIDR